jgi:hypothetical protein
MYSSFGMKAKPESPTPNQALLRDGVVELLAKKEG